MNVSVSDKETNGEGRSVFPFRLITSLSLPIFGDLFYPLERFDLKEISSPPGMLKKNQAFIVSFQTHKTCCSDLKMSCLWCFGILTTCCFC